LTEAFDRSKEGAKVNEELSSDWILQCTTHIELLQTRALLHPDQRVYTFLADGETETDYLTYAQLDQQARSIAARLQTYQVYGQPVLLLYQPGLAYLAAFFGCLYAGAIAVPAYPPRLNHKMERLEAIVEDAQPVLALSSQTLITTAMSKQFASFSHLGELHIATTDELPLSLAEQWQKPEVHGETLAFLQYSSGSTGKPKGVMVSHSNLLYNHRMMHIAFRHPVDAPFVSWLPLFHDMGLIGKALQSIYIGTQCVFMSPFSFLQKPFRWLQAISRYKAYGSYAPNFAYDLCVQQITPEQRATLDLSHWKNAVNAAEPIRSGTLERFASTFASCGFRREAFVAGYGLAEATLIVSTSHLGEPFTVQTVQGNELEQQLVVPVTSKDPRGREIVGCGTTWLEQKIVVVDPETSKVCPPERIGEIWLAGQNITQGYWKHPQETRETFQAHLAETGEGPFLRTGDLGFLSQGELFITGRLKDLIIVYGKNFYPQDIELTAEQSHQALRANSNAAFALEVAGKEQVILVQEIERQYRHKNPEDIFAAMRQAVFEEHELHLDGIILIKPGSIPKTSSGKIQRHACRAALLAHTLPLLFVDASTKINELIQETNAPGPQHISATQNIQTTSQFAALPTLEAGSENAREHTPSSIQVLPIRQESDSTRRARPMHFSLLYFASNDAVLSTNKYELLLEGARFADQHEFTAVWIPERHFHPFGGLYPNPSVLAAALAIATTRIRLRAGSVVLPMHHPARVAEEWSVVDNLSSGRVDLAFATGWNPNDFALAPENYAGRKDILYAGIEAFHKLWGGEAVTWPNGLGKETPLKIYPQPVQPRLTPWITCTGNPERFIEAGALGANVLTGLLFQSVEELAEKIRLYREARASHGHDPAQGQVTLMLHTFIDEDLEEVRRKVRQPFTAYLESSVDLWRNSNQELDKLTPQEREKVLSYAFERYFQTHALFGTPQSSEKMVAHLGEIGVDEIASLIDFGLDVDTVMDGLHWLNVLRKRCQKWAPSERALKSERRASVSSTEVSQPPDQPPSGALGFDQLASDQRQGFLRDYLQQQIAQVLEIQAEHITNMTNLRSLGLDSLKVMSIVNNCQRDLDIMPDAGLFYQYTSLESLAAYLAEEYQQNLIHQSQAHPARDNTAVVRRQERQMYFPQSFAQQRLWFLNQLQPDNIAYNVPTAITITGKLEMEALRRSLETIIWRHEILRTTFDIHQEGPVQIINAPEPFVLPVVDLSTHSPQERQKEARLRAIQEGQHPFDLIHGPLIRATLLRLDPTESLLLLTYHHIVADGWSRGILVNELKTLYAAFIAGQPDPLEALPIQYADFAVWQAEWLRGAAPSDRHQNQENQENQEQTRLAKHVQYWKKQLAGPLPVLELPTDHPRPPIQTFHGAHLAINIPEQLLRDLQSLSQREGVTLFMTLLASFQILLARYSGQEEIITGSPIAGRTRAETENLIGFFVNALVLRTNLSGNPTFQTALQRVRDVCLNAYTHQEVPFEQVVEAVYPVRDLSRSPLFQVMFGLHEMSWWLEAEVGDIKLRQVEMESYSSVFDITWSVTTSGFGQVEYNTDLFEQETIIRLRDHWYELLRQIVANPGQRLAKIPLLTSAEQARILVEWNQTERSFPQTRCLHQIFQQQARLAPTAIAIKTPHTSLTYQEVESRANQLAHTLCRQGLSSGQHVGVCMSRVPEAIIGLLAILKAGGVYVPLDPRYPQDRLAFMVEDAQLSALLTQQKVRHCLPELAGVPVLYLEADWFESTREAVDPPTREVTSTMLAYVIYTSGSTGRPKGVQVSHQGLQNLIEVQQRNFEIQPEDRVLQFSSLSFDASIWEICMSIGTGATLCMDDEDTILAGPMLAAALTKMAITVVTLPPSLLASLSTTNLPQLRTIIVAGEACPPELATHWAAGRRFFNAYGPTEATVCATLERCVGTLKPSIGRPIDNTQAYILDPALHPVPIGVAGELYIGGINLAYGYLHQPELTAERFLPHPFIRQAGARLYRTGDRCRYKPDETIEFLGRVDDQVKIRGHRIEPGEIEAVLALHPTIRECAVVVKNNVADEQQLVAFVVTHEASAFSRKELYAYLQHRLPEYMLPARILPLEHMLLTPNGKIDRKGLPDATAVHQPAETSQDIYLTSMERSIAIIWQDCLHLEKVGLHENFFELGGHSLLVVQVIQKTQEQFQREIALTDLFEYPTVSAFASYLEQISQPTNLVQVAASTLPMGLAEDLKSGQNRLKNRRMLQEKE
jgi:natural product biosynthesis luciferase-like monooxygenase protein/amino acid adenylation domain-containing protein